MEYGSIDDSINRILLLSVAALFVILAALFGYSYWSDSSLFPGESQKIRDGMKILDSAINVNQYEGTGELLLLVLISNPTEYNVEVSETISVYRGEQLVGLEETSSYVKAQENATLRVQIELSREFFTVEGDINSEIKMTLKTKTWGIVPIYQQYVIKGKDLVFV